MTIRNYRAHSIEEAIAAAREDLGPDAIILSTRNRPGPHGLAAVVARLLGRDRRGVFELTAATPDQVPTPAPTALPPWDIEGDEGEFPADGLHFRELDDGEIEFVGEIGLVAVGDAVGLSVDPGAEPDEPHAEAEAEVEVEAEKGAGSEPDAAPIARRIEFGAAIEPKPLGAGATATDPELESIRALVGAVLERRSTLGVDPRPVELAALAARLADAELDAELAGRICADLARTLPREALASPVAVRAAAVERLAALLPASCQAGLEPDSPELGGGWRRDGRPRTIAFIGPTGVGKTTTVAKVAASLRLRFGARVALVTSDTYRIAAVEQLRTYAEIIGLPLEVVRSPGQMVQACLRLNAFDVILIDTAGRGQKDRDRIAELKAIVDAAAPHERQLVLSAVAGGKALAREAEAFATVGVDRVLLTKLDEAVALGPLFRILPGIGRPLSFFTSGQEVPQNIEPARPRRLAELLVGLEAGPVVPTMPVDAAEGIAR